ncbi:hypothetical protein Pyn_17819 [Prunus yedoensis var. nudiflora]|uniref:Uncharacterized protein n=1 Tax=Prunus yedoensis var. nudiflora TaxID=2094558 RepID=A0A314YBN6_PRUYE|nr:hypothetical protein Pyn_17819 [Prunus yedoensis var. nudiflora]
MKGIPTPGTHDQKNMKRRRAEQQRISALETKVELLLNSASTMQDLNNTFQHKKQAVRRTTDWPPSQLTEDPKESPSGLEPYQTGGTTSFRRGIGVSTHPSNQ